MSIEFLTTDFEKVNYLSNLLTSSATGGDAAEPEYKALRHELLSNPQISSLLPDWLKIHRNLSSFWGFIQPKFGTYADRRKFLSEEFSPVLNFLEFGHTVETEKKQNPKPSKAKKIVFPSLVKKKIFIVHGRDNEAKQEVSRYIESLDVEVIILHEQASSGMTIIEKIEHYSNEADFALVLYTACDLGREINETKVPPPKQGSSECSI
jgi:hypothetical protein